MSSEEMFDNYKRNKKSEIGILEEYLESIQNQIEALRVSGNRGYEVFKLTSSKIETEKKICELKKEINE